MTDKELDRFIEELFNRLISKGWIILNPEQATKLKSNLDSIIKNTESIKLPNLKWRFPWQKK
jgi:hypothetical protein